PRLWCTRAGQEVDEHGHRVILKGTPGRVISPNRKTMAAPASIDAAEWLRRQNRRVSTGPAEGDASGDGNLLMSAEVDAVCGAGYRERSDERGNQRNGYRERAWDSRVGTIGRKIPKVRHGSYFPAWLLESRRRAGKALTAVVAEAYLLGVS